jgi:hypothetical protein
MSDPESCEEVLAADGRTLAVTENWNVPNRGVTLLMSLAPELLDALADVTKELKQMHDHYLPFCKVNCPTSVYVKTAEALISKVLTATTKGDTP